MPAWRRRLAGTRPDQERGPAWPASSLEHDLDHGMRRQGPVQLVELLAAGRVDRYRDAQIVAGLAGAKLDAGGVEAGVELPGDPGDGFHETVHLGTHDLDREARRVFDQRIRARTAG